MMIELVLLAAIAIFVFAKLKNTLGTRTGFEDPTRIDPGAEKSRGRPDFVVVDGGQQQAEAEPEPVEDLPGVDADTAAALRRMAVAEPRDRPFDLRRGADLKVATKYPVCAQRHYRRRGIDPEIIQLYGSVELGPITGLADQIVDLVESGETLRQNDLVEVETIFEVSSRLVVHPPSLKLEPGRLNAIIDAVRAAVERRSKSRRAS